MIAGGRAMRPGQQRKANLRLALILASLALAFALGFVAKMAWFSGL
jgi:hypothetical protein